MQQRQLRLGDILDDYCPRERRLTNHAVVAMVGPDVKQTRCTTCDAEHEYKHAKVPRQRRKDEGPAALYSQVLTAARKRAHVDSEVDGDVPEPASIINHDPVPEPVADRTSAPEVTDSRQDDLQVDEVEDVEGVDDHEEGPVHRPLIRATLPRQEGQPPATRPAPDFTIRQPGGRTNRFRPRHGGAQSFHGNRANGNLGPMRSGARQGGRPPMPSRPPKRHDGGGRKRSK